MSKKMPIILRR